MNDESARKGAHETAGRRSAFIIAPGTDSRESAESWARRKIARLARGHAVPLYGDEQWLALAEDDPLRFASVIQAAEAARRHRSVEQITADLIAQQQLIDRLLLERVRGASWDVAGVRDWRAFAMTPTYDELAERRRRMYEGAA